MFYIVDSRLLLSVLSDNLFTCNSMNVFTSQIICHNLTKKPHSKRSDHQADLLLTRKSSRVVQRQIMCYRDSF